MSRLSGPGGRLGNSAAVRSADADRALPASVRQAKSFAAVEPRSLSIRLRLTTPSQRSRRPEPSSNPIDRPGYRTPPRPASSRVTTFVAERRRGDFRNSPPARTCAQSRAVLESLRARVPHTVGCEFSQASVVRTDALQSKQARSRAAYGVPAHTSQPCVPRPRQLPDASIP